MGRFTGILGILTMLALAFTFSTNRRAIRLKTVAWGLGLQNQCWAYRVSESRQRCYYAAGLRLRGIAFRVWGSGEAGITTRLLRFWRAADRHLHRRILCCALSLRHHANHHPRVCLGDDPRHGRERSRIAERRRQHLHGTNGSAVDDPAVPARSDPVRVDDRHDQWHGARFGRHYGCLYSIWH